MKDFDNVRFVDPDNLPGRLYHGTSVYNLAKMLSDNILFEGVHWGKINEPNGPRTSMDYEIAKGFIEYSAPEYAMGGVLSLSGERLFNDYDLVHYNDTYSNGDFMRDEQEVAIIAPHVQDLEFYIDEIICNDHTIEWAMEMENLELAMQVGGWPFNGPPEEQIKDARRCLNHLMENQLRIQDSLSLSFIDSQMFMKAMEHA